MTAYKEMALRAVRRAGETASDMANAIKDEDWAEATELAEELRFHLSRAEFCLRMAGNGDDR